MNLRGWLPAAYVQDDWKVSKKLTVNLGMRYEVGLPFYDKQNPFRELCDGSRGRLTWCWPAVARGMPARRLQMSIPTD